MIRSCLKNFSMKGDNLVIFQRKWICSCKLHLIGTWWVYPIFLGTINFFSKFVRILKSSLLLVQMLIRLSFSSTSADISCGWWHNRLLEKILISIWMWNNYAVVRSNLQHTKRGCWIWSEFLLFCLASKMNHLLQMLVKNINKHSRFNFQLLWWPQNPAIVLSHKMLSNAIGTEDDINIPFDGGLPKKA